MLILRSTNPLAGLALTFAASYVTGCAPVTSPVAAETDMGMAMASTDGAVDPPPSFPEELTTAGTTGTTGTTSTTSTDTTDTTDTTTGDEVPLDCLGQGGDAPNGSGCVLGADCMSGVCVAFTNRPLDPDAVCEAAPIDCSTRVTGTVWDLSAVVDSGVPAPLDGVTFNLISFIGVLSGAANAPSLGSGVSDAEGHIDIVSQGPPSAPIAILGIVGAGAYHLTATLVARAVRDGYDVGGDVHEFWVVRNDMLAAWSIELANDPAIAAEDLPLGDAGGVVGFVRDEQGIPVAGATVTPASADSDSVIRFPQADGTFNANATGPSGTFVVFRSAATGEEFMATAGLTSATARTGNAEGVIFTLVLDLG